MQKMATTIGIDKARFEIGYNKTVIWAPPCPTLFCLVDVILVLGCRPRLILRHLAKINMMLDSTSPNNCLMLKT